MNYWYLSQSGLATVATLTTATLLLRNILPVSGTVLRITPFVIIMSYLICLDQAFGETPGYRGVAYHYVGLGIIAITGTIAILLALRARRQKRKNPNQTDPNWD